MWDLPGPGLESVSPALAGRFLTTAPPGSPRSSLLNKYYVETLDARCFPGFISFDPHVKEICFFFFGSPRGLQDLNSPTRDRTRAPFSGRAES